MNDLDTSFSNAILSGRVTIRVKPNAKSNQLLDYNLADNSYKVAIKARAEKGAANKELAKFVSKLVKRKVEIIRGFTSRTKILRIVE